MAFFHEDISREEVILYLGALFHDVGKFSQRTGDGEQKKVIQRKFATIIGDENRDCIKHQEWSTYFADKFLNDDLAGTVILKHHRPETLLQYLVAIGDKLSAAEREPADTEQKPDAKTVPLVAILSQVSINGNQSETAYKKLQPISTKSPDDLAPAASPEKALSNKAYVELWGQFINELKGIDFKNENHKLWVLTSLLEKYSTNIPSAAYYSKPTISLWLHSKLTAAIAFALYRQGLDLEKAEVIEKALKEKYFHNKENLLLDESHLCLLKADISGIQNFVYDTAMDGAVKALRGRSFYISYLMETIAKYILYSEKLPVTNILYSGGGHFYLLLPAKTLGRLETYREKCEQVLYAAHNGKLAVLLDAVTLKYRDFGEEYFVEKWQEVSSKIQIEKGKKFWRLIRKQQENFFRPLTVHTNVCPHCGRNAESDECTFCNDFVELGDKLIKSKYICEKNLNSPKEGVSDLKSIFRAFGIQFDLESKPAAGRCFAFQETDYSWDDSYGMYRLGSIFPVKQDGSIKNFEEIAKGSQGIKTWGVLRGDVDNLGKVFLEGLGKDKSISRVVALSCDISFFFGGILPKLIANSPYSDRAGVVYSGGDDFFIVGSWDVLPLIADMINRKFKEYIAHNPSLTISMAISLSPNYKYPLYRVALDAGEELDERAKNYSRLVEGRVHDKDALAFLNTAIAWEELPEMMVLQELIVSALKEGAPHALLQILYKACNEKDNTEVSGEIYKAWRIIYSLARMRQRVKASKEKIDEIQDKILKNGNRLYKFTAQAARWAELLSRDMGGN